MSNEFRSLEPATRLFLATLAAQSDPPLSEASLAVTRVSPINAQAGDTGKLTAGIQDDVLATGPTGKVAIRIVRPRNNTSALPAVMFFHGGGWVLGDKDTHDRLVREIANGAEAALIVVDFDRSPEVRFPIAIEQAYAATKYVAEHAEEWNLDGSRLAVVGDSAGGNMAEVVNMLARDRKGPNIALRVLFYPNTDSNFASPSHLQFADKLIDAGVTATAIRAVGTIHGFVTLNALANTPDTKAAMGLANERLQNAFSVRRAYENAA